MSTVFYKGLVVDVLNSTSLTSVTNDSIGEIRKNMNSDAMKNFPRNTVVVKTLSEGLAKRSEVKTICYPFFSSHLCMPLKVGEYVWFVYEDPGRKGSIAYWLSRVCEPDHVEDANYNFSSRSYVQIPQKPAKKSSEKFDGPTVDEGEQQTYSWQSPTSDPTEMVKLIELAKLGHRFEPVPRYTKRAGDLVLQGSNNSLIMLGEERGHWAPNQYLVGSANNPADGIEPGHPAIDIVVGRGSKGGTASVGLTNDSFGVTKGKTLVNELGIEELDKREPSVVEGDAHFYSDASRIYLTANSSNVNSSYHPDFLLGDVAPNSSAGSETTLRSEGAFAVIKSDNLRLIARNTGTFRIIKEPTDGKNDGAGIMINSDGTLQIAAGQKIYLTSYLTAGATQPYVRYDELLALLNSLLDDINTFCATMVTHITPGFGAPSPQITAASATLQASITAKKALLSLGQVLVDGSPQNLGSIVILGE